MSSGLRSLASKTFRPSGNHPSIYALHDTFAGEPQLAVSLQSFRPKLGQPAHPLFSPLPSHRSRPGSQPTDPERHTSCVSQALVPTLADSPPHVCHRQRDGAVSIDSHMQQDMGISSAPPHLGTPFPLFDTVHVRKPRTTKLAITSTETSLSFVSVAARVFRPAGPLAPEGHRCVWPKLIPAWIGLPGKIPSW